MATANPDLGKQENDDLGKLRAQISRLEAELAAQKSPDAVSRQQADAELAYRDARVEFERRDLELKLELAHREAELELQRKDAEVDFLRKQAQIETEHRKAQSELERRRYESKFAREGINHGSAADRLQTRGSRYSSVATSPGVMNASGSVDVEQLSSMVDSVATAYADQIKIVVDVVGSIADAVVRSSIPSRPTVSSTSPNVRPAGLTEVVNQMMAIPRRVLRQL